MNVNEKRIREEIRRRIRVCMAAYSYEILNESIMADHEFDSECLKIDLSIDTGNTKMDKWFRENFQPHTGMWIRKHPDQEGLARLLRGLQTHEY